MTTTSTYTGMGDEPKPSSRVLKPPGGGSSNIFGSDDTAPSAPKPRAQASKPTDHAIFPGGAGSDGSSRAQRSARDGDNSFNRLFGDSSDPYQKGTSASQRVNTYSNIFGGDEPPAARQQQLPSTPKQSGSTYDHIFGDTPAAANGGGASGRYTGKGRGSYNPITGADYKDLAPNHHALHIRETPKAQKEQPPLPCSEGELQAKEGKMQNVQTSTRVTNPPGGKTHKLW